MSDESDICFLAAEYARRFDLRDAEGFADLFTDDATVLLPTGHCLIGREKLLKAVRNTPPGGVHLPEAVTVHISGGDATGTSRFLFRTDDGTEVTGRYEDHFVRTVLGWKIAERRSVLDESPN